jgi:competence protein ComEC
MMEPQRSQISNAAPAQDRKDFSRPLVPILLAMISGIIAGFYLSGYSIAAYFAMTSGIIFIISGLLTEKPVFPALLLLFLSYGYISIQPYTCPVFPPNHVINYADKYKWLIVGIVDEKPVKYKDRIRFTLKAETLGSARTPVTGDIRVTASKIPDGLSAGDRISFVSGIGSVRTSGNPGGFDYKNYMALKKIWATASVNKDYPIDIEKKTSETSVLEDFRDNISELIEETGPGDHVGILKALIIGDKSEISQAVREDFSRAGIAHILAISGLHIGIISGLALVFFRWLLSRFEFLLWKAWVKKGAAILALFPVIAYGLIAGMDKSDATQRSVIMFAFLLAATVFETDDEPMNMLAIAALLILLIHPPSLFSVSFQLSFSGVFSMLYAISQIKRRDIFAVTLSTILGTLPITMYYYNQVSLAGLFANFVFIPVIGFVVLPAGLLSVILYPFSIRAASICIHISAFALRNTIEVVTPDYLEISGFYILAWAVLQIKTIHPEASDKKDIFRRKRAIAVAAVICIAFAADVCYWLNKRFWHEDLRVTVIDVGQGTSSLIEFPGGDCLLADGGGSSDNSSFDVGERILNPFLLYKRIKTIEIVVLSHPDSDHLNGLLYIAEHFNVKEVWATYDKSIEPNYFEFIDIIKKKSIRQPEFEEIFGGHENKKVKLEVLYPPTDFAERKGENNWRNNTNNNSLVLKVTFGNISFLFPGDIEAPAEKELVAIAGDKLKSTVLIAPHHGSKTSSTEEFLKAVSPEYIIISLGWNNRFHFPHQQVMNRYEALGYKVFRTDIHGAVSISTDGNSSIRLEPHIRQIVTLPGPD